MRLPSTLPPHLHYHGRHEDEEQLLSILIQNRTSCVTFLEYAMEDETWSEEHPRFMSGALAWLTNQYLEGLLNLKLAQRIIKMVHLHYKVMKEFLPKDIDVHMEEHHLGVNSMAWGSASPYFDQRIQSECRNHQPLVLKKIPIFIFRHLATAINQGEDPNLWKLTREDVMAILFQAKEWELSGLVDSCQIVLRRYISEENVFDVFKQSHEEKWPILREAALHFLNRQPFDIEWCHSDIDSVHCVFKEDTERAIEAFTRVRLLITHIGYQGDLPGSSLFQKTIGLMPRLVSLDLSRTTVPPKDWRAIPQTLREIDLSGASWLDERHLQELIECHPYLTRLQLREQGDLPYTSWQMLHHLKYLAHMDLGFCSQLRDDDLQIILRGCRRLISINLENCRHLTDRAFVDLKKINPQLEKVSIAHCLLTEQGIMSLVEGARHLQSLDLTGCSAVTNRVLEKILRYKPTLKLLE